MTSLPTLTEHKTAEAVALAQAQVDALRSSVDGLTVQPTLGQPGRYDLTPGSTIGAASIAGMDVVIQPKVGIEQLLVLISYAAKRMKWSVGSPDLAPDATPLDAVALLFARLAIGATDRGLLRDYRRIDDTLDVVRGRVRMAELVSVRHGRVPPIDVSYDIYTPDTAENRVLLGAAELLRRLPLRSDAAREAAGMVWRRLVNDVELDDLAGITPLTWTRLNEHYRPAVELGQLILRSSSVAVSAGPTETPGFFVNMAAVFEDFVVEALRDALARRDRSLVLDQSGTGRRLRLDEAGKIRLEPDISIWRGRDPVAIGDVKYKRINAAGVKHPDLYQLLAYLVSTGLDHGVLIYAKGEDEAASREVVNLGRRLDVVAIDLETDIAGLLEQIDSVAGRLLAGQ